MNIVPQNYFYPIRVDKNVAFNIAAFREFGDDSKILKAIIIYMAINHQEEDLFGFYKLDPKKFAKEMYLQESHLFRMHPSPFFIEHDPNARVLIDNEQKEGRMSSHRTWSTYFENALYILTNRSIIDDYRYKEGNKTIVSTRRFNFIDEIRFELVKTGKTKRILYYYKPNKIYEENLKTYFLNTKIQKYNRLKKPKLDEAYLDILNRINNTNIKNLNSIKFSIDTLANILQVKPYKRFSSYKIKVTEKFEVLRKVIDNDIRNLQLTWANPSKNIGTYISKVDKTKPKVIYDNIAIISWERLTKKEQSAKDSKTYKNLFETELNRSLIKAFFRSNRIKLKSHDEDYKKKLFYSWILSENDMDIKEIKYQDTYLFVYKNTDNIKSHTKTFLKTLKYLAKLKEEHDCFRFSNDLLYFVTKDKETQFKHFYELLNHFHKYANK